MDFLVRVDCRLPPELTESERAALLRSEAERGRQLAAEGVIRHIWRLPGALAHVGVWSAPDATVLHEALVSLPVWRYARTEVTALARHPLAAMLPQGSTIGG